MVFERRNFLRRLSIVAASVVLPSTIISEVRKMVEIQTLGAAGMIEVVGTVTKPLSNGNLDVSRTEIESFFDGIDSEEILAANLALNSLIERGEVSVVSEKTHPDAFVRVSRWKSEADLRSYLDSPAMASLICKMKKLGYVFDEKIQALSSKSTIA
jgi:hypothetical protein